MACEGVTLFWCVFVNTQVDFWVYKLVVVACKQAKLRQEIEHVVSVLVNTAKHHALTIIALLNADIDIAVLVE